MVLRKCSSPLLLLEALPLWLSASFCVSRLLEVRAAQGRLRDVKQVHSRRHEHERICDCHKPIQACSHVHLQTERGRFARLDRQHLKSDLPHGETGFSQRLHLPIIHPVFNNTLTWTWRTVSGDKSGKAKQGSEGAFEQVLIKPLYVKNMNLVDQWNRNIRAPWTLSTQVKSNSHAFPHQALPQHLHDPISLSAYTKPVGPRGVESLAPPTKTALL